MPSTALITGASSGIGATYAIRLAERDYDLVLVARDQARLDDLAGRIRSATGRSVEVLQADLTRPAELDMVRANIEDDEAISMLINNAGMSLRGDVITEDPADVARLIALNISATTVLAGAAARAFPGRDQAAIVNVSSVLALSPEGFDGVYSGSKAYLLNLSLSLSQALKEKGVRVQALLPGATRTAIWARSGKDLESFPPEIVMEVENLVDAALVGLDRGEAVTIPSLADDRQWSAMTAARLAMGPNLSRREVASRYQKDVAGSGSGVEENDDDH